MGYKRSNYAVNSSLSKTINFAKQVNITSIIKRNKIEEQKDKFTKIITLAGSFTLLIVIIGLKIL
tara:strand:+ start:326 stop:520 length:195 start_codon:yes stop_codon:yes gene_type:complete